MGMVEAREKYLAEYGPHCPAEDAFDAGYEAAFAELENSDHVEGRRQADYVHGTAIESGRRA